MPEKVINVEFECPMCGIRHYLYNIPISKVERVRNRYETGEYIQSIFPDMKRSDREKFITGYCDDCQAKIFGTAIDED